MIQAIPCDNAMMGAYADSILKTLCATETNLLPHPAYMSVQTDITERMRAILVDWLVDVHIKFNLRSETLYLTINVIDRFLSTTDVPRTKLQLVGVTAMWIAAKFEEIYAPDLSDLLYIVDNTYTAEEILNMEITILEQLQHNVATVTPLSFVERFAKIAGADKKTQTAALYVLERTLQEYSSLKFLPSTLAAAAVSVACRDMALPNWPEMLLQHTGLAGDSIVDAELMVLDYIQRAEQSSLKAVVRKYSGPKYHNV